MGRAGGSLVVALISKHTYCRPGLGLASVASCPAGVGALMPRHSPYRIELSDEERDVLESLARSYTLPYWQVVRAQMVLLAARGLRNDQIAARLNCRREVVSQWRKRFFEQRLAGLEDLPRRGRPPTFPRSMPFQRALWIPAGSRVALPSNAI